MVLRSLSGRVEVYLDGRTTTRDVAALIAGAVLALAAWLALVPWDLSELAKDGTAIDGRSGDDHAPVIFAVGAVVVGCGVAALIVRTLRQAAAAFVFGGLLAWTVLFGWRAGVSRVTGANFFMVPLVLFFIPATLLVPLVVAAIAAWLDRIR